MIDSRLEGLTHELSIACHRRWTGVVSVVGRRHLAETDAVGERRETSIALPCSRSDALAFRPGSRSDSLSFRFAAMNRALLPLVVFFVSASAGLASNRLI